MRYLVVFVTCPGKRKAQTLALDLVRRRLVACATVIEKVSSYFWWNNAVDTARESLLVMKTRKALFTKLERRIRSMHPYEVPEIIAVPIERANKRYLSWLDDACSVTQ